LSLAEPKSFYFQNYYIPIDNIGTQSSGTEPKVWTIAKKCYGKLQMQFS